MKNIHLMVAAVITSGLVAGCQTLVSAMSPASVAGDNSPVKLKTTTPIPTKPIAFTATPPTGKLVFIYLTGQAGDRQSRLVECNLDGSQARVLSVVDGTMMSLSASPTDKRVIYTVQTGRTHPQIVTLDRSTGQATTVSPIRTNSFSGAISPDGKQLLLSHSATGNPDIFLTDSLGHHAKQLINQPSIDIAPVWSPDGRGFLFTSDRDKFLYPQVYHYDLGNQHIQLITQTGRTNAMARYHPSGKLISYVTNNAQGMLLDLTTHASIAINQQGLTEPANFSPDGNYLLYSAKNHIQIVATPNIYQQKFLPLQPGTSIRVAGYDDNQSTIREPIWVND